MQMLTLRFGTILAPIEGVVMLTILGTLVWLILPITATVVAYFLLRRRLKAGVNSLREFRTLLNSDQD